MKPIVVLEAADEELVEAAKFYERTLRGGFRRRLLRRFPYGILYKEEESQIVIVAVMHLQRRPGYWRNR